MDVTENVNENEHDEYMVRLAVLCQGEDAKIAFIKACNIHMDRYIC